MNREDLLKRMCNLVSGLELLRIGPEGEADECSERTIRAMRNGDLEELNHLSALQLVFLGPKAPKFAVSWQIELDKIYHAEHCEFCKSSREGR